MEGAVGLCPDLIARVVLAPERLNQPPEWPVDRRYQGCLRPEMCAQLFVPAQEKHCGSPAWARWHPSCSGPSIGMLRRLGSENWEAERRGRGN